MHAPPDASLQHDLLRLLRGQAPAGVAPEAAIDDALRRYECGGYLHRACSRDGRTGDLPQVWAAALERTHRKLVIDNLAALAAFREVGRHLAKEGATFILLKGAAYLDDLYDDPGARLLTDIDLLLRRGDAGRVARRLRAAGYVGEIGVDYPEFRRFEMWRPGAGHTRLEFHWWLGLPLRFNISQDALWERSTPAALEGIACRRLGPEDALLFHVAHLSDHYFGPSLKWVLDLREMFRGWTLDRETLVARATGWRLQVPLYLSLSHMEKLFPGEAPAGLRDRLTPGRPRLARLRRWMSQDPLEFLRPVPQGPSRYPLRCLLIDRPVDAALLAGRVLSRPLTRPLAHLLGRATPPWEWRI